MTNSRNMADVSRQQGAYALEPFQSKTAQSLTEVGSPSPPFIRIRALFDDLYWRSETIQESCSFVSSTESLPLNHPDQPAIVIFGVRLPNLDR